MLKRIRQALKSLASKLKPAARLVGSALALLLLLGAVGATLVYVPHWQADGASTERFEAENEARRTLAQILLGLGGIVALYAAWRRTRALEENVKVGQENIRVAQEGQITERFTKAIEQLAATDKDGNPAIEVRLGGIYALERIARDSERDHWTVMEVLTAYGRKNAAWKYNIEGSSGVADDSEETPSDDAAGFPEVPIDIQAILTVLGRRERGEKREQRRHLNLAATDLGDADLSHAHLEKADLSFARLPMTNLSRAHLEEANLENSHLQSTRLMNTHLEGANLEGTHLKQAFLYEAHLEGAKLSGAHLEEAKLSGADLEGANLSGAHLAGAYLYEAHLGGANLRAADLEGVDLHGAHLERASLYHAHLGQANLNDADLEGANLSGAHLEGADLNDAHLAGAHLYHAHLEGALSLTQEQLEKAQGSSRTTLPDGLTHPAHWQVTDNS